MQPVMVFLIDGTSYVPEAIKTFTDTKYGYAKNILCEQNIKPGWEIKLTRKGKDKN